MFSGKVQGMGQGCRQILAFQSKIQKLVLQYRHLSLSSELEKSGGVLMTVGLTAVLLHLELSLLMVWSIWGQLFSVANRRNLMK